MGSAITLSVQTPDHLRKLKLSSIPTNFNNVDMFKDINFLYSMALQEVAHLPFVYLVDKYRYDVFAGKIKTDELNSKWWSSVLKNQGLCAPVARTEEDFDAGSKYHVPADVPYMRYFVAGILQFQIHKALCERSGHVGPLYACNIDGSKQAGKLLQEVMSLGSSVPWQVVLEKLTGSPKMDASALLEYFEPLTDWLENYNSDGNSVGWDSLAASEAICPQDSSSSSGSPPELTSFP
ncbi:hypothetical protein RvY_05165 [Ramazzottius varieornatus]|uniref:Angiotensin-converting enzyme n=1 Tax=Ramazzottius varieornatus TaxID=947166 RepID=A0A1D1V0T7_RAMVA|nr:hypothetical protein RvY_05165 [Ramazzottius varieornatus]